jgi:hypothetical protein
VSDGQKLKKKLPKRVISLGLQARRARSWARGQERKKARNAAQEQRHRDNLARIAEGLPTVHEQKKLDAKVRKASSK